MPVELQQLVKYNPRSPGWSSRVDRLETLERNIDWVALTSAPLSLCCCQLARCRTRALPPALVRAMFGLKNSPFGERLRAAHQDADNDTPCRNRQRVHPAFVPTLPPAPPVSIPALSYSQLTASDTPGPDSPEHPSRARREYGDRFVPSRDTGDMRTSYYLRDDSGPSTPSKHRTIPPNQMLSRVSLSNVARLIPHSPSPNLRSRSMATRTSQRHIQLHPPQRSHPSLTSSSRITNQAHPFILVHCTHHPNASAHLPLHFPLFQRPPAGAVSTRQQTKHTPCPPRARIITATPRVSAAPASQRLQDALTGSSTPRILQTTFISISSIGRVRTCSASASVAVYTFGWLTMPPSPSCVT